MTRFVYMGMGEDNTVRILKVEGVREIKIEHLGDDSFFIRMRSAGEGWYTVGFVPKSDAILFCNQMGIRLSMLESVEVAEPAENSES